MTRFCNGSRDKDIAGLQERLNEARAIRGNSQISVDGDWGPQTETALRFELSSRGITDLPPVGSGFEVYRDKGYFVCVQETTGGRLPARNNPPIIPTPPQSGHTWPGPWQTPGTWDQGGGRPVAPPPIGGGGRW